jgi:hypothetical protein
MRGRLPLRGPPHRRGRGRRDGARCAEAGPRCDAALDPAVQAGAGRTRARGGGRRGAGAPAPAELVDGRRGPRVPAVRGHEDGCGLV